MHYVYIEDSKVISILNYEANVGDTVECVEITDVEYDLISKDQPLHWFNVDSKKVESIPEEISNGYDIEKQNQEARLFLDSTDWKVLRHIREKALGLETSLTEEEYLELEEARADAASKIK